MSESFWQKPNESLTLPEGTIYAQTFSPLWSHSLDEIRVYVRHTDYPTRVKVSIQYLNPAGEPDGVDLSATTIAWEHIPWGAYTNVHQEKMPPIRLVKGIDYAFLIETLDCEPIAKPSTLYQPAPSGYPRGKLIKSTDGGDTWDTTDLGDLLFSEFGDPPLKPCPYTPPFDHWSVTDLGRIDYSTASCIRMATSSPTTATLMLATEKPQPIEEGRTTRGVVTFCLDHYTFKVARTYDQLEKNESIYHTFHVTKLKTGEKYWYVFIADANFSATPSVSPIFEVTHPGGSSFTTIRRPDAPGDFCLIDWQAGDPCPDHYLNVDEASSDGDDTFVSTRYSDLWKRDLYHIPSLDVSHAVAPFKELQITARWRRQGGMAYVHIAKIGIKVNGVEWWTPAYNDIGTNYENEHLHLTENPITGLPWTYAELTAVQIGVSLRHYSGVGWGSHCRVTQLYSKVIHDCSAYE